VNPQYTSPEKPKLIEQSFKEIQMRRQQTHKTTASLERAQKALKAFQSNPMNADLGEVTDSDT